MREGSRCCSWPRSACAPRCGPAPLLAASPGRAATSTHGRPKYLLLLPNRQPTATPPHTPPRTPFHIRLSNRAKGAVGYGRRVPGASSSLACRQAIPTRQQHASPAPSGRACSSLLPENHRRSSGPKQISCRAWRELPEARPSRVQYLPLLPAARSSSFLGQRVRSTFPLGPRKGRVGTISTRKRSTPRRESALLGRRSACQPVGQRHPTLVGAHAFSRTRLRSLARELDRRPRVCLAGYRSADAGPRGL